MPNFSKQPLVQPLPTGLSLEGKVIIVTGATAGLGLETCRQALALKASTVVLACRNVAKGESTKELLLKDPSIKKHNPNAIIKVLKVDTGDYKSVKSFAEAVKAEIPVVDILVLNAGLGYLPKFQKSPSGHETTYQINYLSNVLLIFELLPHLEASADKTGHASRITWVGSRTHYETSLESQKPIPASQSISQYFDSESDYLFMKRYGDSKLLCHMFVHELGPRINKDKVVLNIVCPGMIHTDMSDNLPFPLRMFGKLVKAYKARPIEQGGWLFINAAAVAGPESHGKFIADKTITEPTAFIRSDAGQKLQKKLWDETLEEMKPLTTIPPEVLGSA